MKKILKVILLVLLVFIVFGTLFFLWKKSQPKKVVYEIVTADIGDVENTSVATGKVSPREVVYLKESLDAIIPIKNLALQSPQEAVKVIGDSLHDVDMVDCRDDRTIVSIGLCNDKIDERIDQYTDAFDIVITHDE